MIEQNYNAEDIFSKFDSITITNSNRIDEEDQAYCEKEQESYNRALDTLNQIRDVIKNTLDINITAERAWNQKGNNEDYLNYYRFDKIPKLYDDCKNNFIHNIIGHFTQKNNITIDSYTICEKYKEREVNYNILLDEIFVQLEGYNFEEKAIKEIKDKMKAQIKLSKRNWQDTEETYNMSIKDKKLIFDNLIYAGKNWNNKYEFRGDNLIPLLSALCHFNNGSKTIYYDLKELCSYSVEEWAFTKHELDYTKFKSLKIYKNSKIEVEFTNNEYARQFALEYCGYNPDTVKQQEAI
jgi:hypothetical protein